MEEILSEDFEGKCEELRQKIHEYTLQRNVNLQTIAAVEADIEYAREARLKSFEEMKLNALKEHNRDVKLMKQELLTLEDEVQDLQLKETSLKQMYSANLQHAKVADISMVEAETSIVLLQTQINSINEENVKLSADIAVTDEGVQNLLSQIEFLEKSVQKAKLTANEQQAAIAELESNLSSLQEEKQMIHLLQESKQFAAVDPNKKGNSMFAEMDDHRRLVEERVVNLQKRCEEQDKTNEVIEEELRRLTNAIEEKMIASQAQMPPDLRKLQAEFDQTHAEQLVLLQRQMIAAAKKLPDEARGTNHHSLSSFLAAKRLELHNMQQSLQNERFLSMATKDQLCKADRSIKSLQKELEVEKTVEKTLTKKIQVKKEPCSERPTVECAPALISGSAVVNVLDDKTFIPNAKKSENDDGGAIEQQQRLEAFNVCDGTGEVISSQESLKGEQISAQLPKSVRFVADSPVALRCDVSAKRDLKNKCVNVKDMQTCNQQ